MVPIREPTGLPSLPRLHLPRSLLLSHATPLSAPPSVVYGWRHDDDARVVFAASASRHAEGVLAPTAPAFVALQGGQVHTMKPGRFRRGLAQRALHERELVARAVQGETLENAEPPNAREMLLLWAVRMLDDAGGQAPDRSMARDMAR